MEGGDVRLLAVENESSMAFAEALVEQVKSSDVIDMVKLQREMLSRYEKTNEMLINFNILSAGRFQTTQELFIKHTELLNEMKGDLDSVFKRIRNLKKRLSALYPEAFEVCKKIVYNSSEDEIELKPPSSSSSSSSSVSSDAVTTDVN